MGRAFSRGPLFQGILICAHLWALDPPASQAADLSQGRRDSLSVRDFVRFSIPHSNAARIYGVVMALDDSLLTIRPELDPDTRSQWTWHTVRSLERYSGTTPGFAMPIFTGGLIGFLGGSIYGYAAGEDCSSGSELCFSREGTAVMVGLVGLGLGLLSGFIVGALIQQDVWVTVEPQAARVQAP